jgi:hypothetical protein
MAHFTAGAKRYPESTSFLAFGATDIGNVTNGTTTDLTAPASLGDPPSARSFLFWDTARRLTPKRRVRWSFNNVDNWSNWHATA